MTSITITNMEGVHRLLLTSSEICKVHDAIFLVARKISNEKRSGTIGHAYLQGPWSFRGDHLAMQDALTSG